MKQCLIQMQEQEADIVMHDGGTFLIFQSASAVLRFLSSSGSKHIQKTIIFELFSLMDRRNCIVRFSVKVVPRTSK